MCEFLQEVRLAFVRTEYLVKLERKPEIAKDPNCLDLINIVKDYHLLPARQHEMATKVARVRATSTLENVLVVLGGCEATRPPYTRSTSTYCYSFRQQTWFKLASLPYDRSSLISSLPDIPAFLFSGSHLYKPTSTWNGC